MSTENDAGFCVHGHPVQPNYANACCNVAVPETVDEFADHRLEAFHLICRDCGSHDAYFARRAGHVGKPMSAICPACGIWELIE